MIISNIRERQKRAYIENYKKHISKLTKPELIIEWNNVRQKLNPDCKMAENKDAGK